MMKKLIFIALLSVVFTIGCHKHDDDTAFVVNITINKPTANQVIARNTAMPVDITLTRENNAVIHNVKVEVINAVGSVVETLLEKHYHTKSPVSFKEDNYRPQATGNFKLKVTASDHNKSQPAIKEVAFSVN